MISKIEIEVLIIEKIKSKNSAELTQLLGPKAKLAEFKGKSIDEILDMYDYCKDKLRYIVFHPSGRHGIKEDDAVTFVEKILKWKATGTLLIGVSEGEAYREKMKEAKADITDSYNTLVTKVKNKANKKNTARK